MANRNVCFSDFSKQKTAKERWHSLASCLGDHEEYLETPLLLPPSLYVCSLVRWCNDQIFWAWWVTNFSYPWCFAGVLRSLKLRYKHYNLLMSLTFSRIKPSKHCSQRFVTWSDNLLTGVAEPRPLKVQNPFWTSQFFRWNDTEVK